MFSRNGKGKGKKKRKHVDEDDEFVPDAAPPLDEMPDKHSDILDSDIVDVNYNQAHGLYERLDDKEKNFLAPRGNYVDSPNLLLRKGFLDNDFCSAFCDVYTWADNPDTGVLTIAVDPSMRGQGLGYLAAKGAIDAASKFGISHFVYRVDKKNKPSIGLAEKLGGQLESEDEKMYRFKIL